jgi:NOL1/NOP2/fmu family ribosome biogenesis protein
VLIYSTCTFNQEEDECVVRRLAEEYGDYLCEAPQVFTDERWGVVTGRESMFQTFRFFPHKVTGEGMFMAVARKCGEGVVRRRQKVRSKAIVKVGGKDAEELSRWVQNPSEMTFFQAGEMLYGCRREHFDDIEMLSGIMSVIYSGVAMGQIFKGKLKPEHPLALFVGVNSGAVPSAELDEATALSYLRRQDISAAPFAEGINIVRYRGVAIGFVKRIGARCNNMYPKEQRIIKN